MRTSLLKHGALALVSLAAAFGVAATGLLTPPQLTDSQSVSDSRSVQSTLPTRADGESKYYEIHEWYVDGATKKFNPAQTDGNIISAEGNLGVQNNYTGSYTTLSGKTIKLTQGIKLAATDKWSFTMPREGDVLIILSTSRSGQETRTIKFDDKKLDINADYATLDSENTVRYLLLENVEAGDHWVTRDNENGLAYVGVGLYKRADDGLEAYNISWNGQTKFSYKVRDALPEMPSFQNTEGYDVSFSSTNEDVASVSNDGIISPKNNTVGTALINATVEGDGVKYKTTTVTVSIEVKTNLTAVNAGVEADEAVKITGLVEMNNFPKDAISAGTVYCDDNFLKVTTPSASKGTDYSADFWGTKFNRYFAVRAKAHPSEGDVVGEPESGKDGAPIVIEPKKDMTLVVYARRQALEDKDLKSVFDDIEKNEITETHYFVPKAGDGKALYIVNQADLTRVPETISIAGYQDKTGQYAHTASLYELKAGEKYTAYSLATTYGIFGFGYIIEEKPATVCAVPTAEVCAFNFEKKGYSITFTAAEGETLMVSKDGAEAVAMTSPATVWDVTTASAYAVAEGLQESEVVEATVPAVEYDATKPYIAWVYAPSYGAASRVDYTKNNALINALNEVGNVVLVEVNNYDVEPSVDLKNADLIVCSEAMTGNKTFTNGLGKFVGEAKMINLKMYNYGNQTDASKRWKWGLPQANNKALTAIYPTNDKLKVLDGVAYNEDGGIEMFTEDKADQNHVQYVTLTVEGHSILGLVSKPVAEADEAEAPAGVKNVAMHCTDKFFGLGLSCDDWEHYGDNAAIIVKNAAQMLLDGENLDAVIPELPVVEFGVNHKAGTIVFGAANDEGHTFDIEGVAKGKELEGEVLDINDPKYNLKGGTVYKITPYVNGVAKDAVHMLTAPKVTYTDISQDEDYFGPGFPYKVYEITFERSAGTQIWFSRSQSSYYDDMELSLTSTRASMPSNYEDYDEYMDSGFWPLLLADKFFEPQIGMSNPKSFIATATAPDGTDLASKELVAPAAEDIETSVIEKMGDSDFTNAKMYDLNGCEVKGEVTPGMYILSNGKKAVKVVIR